MANGLSPKKARRGFEEGRRFNQILKEVRQEFGPDAAGSVNYELRKSPTDSPDVSATVQKALELFRRGQIPSTPQQTIPTPEQLASSKQAIERSRLSRPSYNASLDRQKAHYLSPEGLKEGLDQLKNLPMAAALIAGVGLPAAIGGSVLARALTGSAISSGTSLPFYDKDTTPGELAFDAAIGTIPAGRQVAAPALAAASLLASPEAEASPLKMLQMLYRGHNGSPSSEIYASAQRPIAEYYANKRTNQYGGTPTIESMLVDPFAGLKYGHSIPIDNLNRTARMTQARKLAPSDIVQKFVKGGLVLHRRLGLPKDEQGCFNTEFLTLDEIKEARGKAGKSWTPLDDRPSLEFAAGGLVAGSDQDSSINDDLMRDLLQVAAEKYHQLGQARV